MGHIQVLFSIVSLFLGLGAVLLNLLLYGKYRSHLFRYLLLYTIPFHLLFILEALRQYCLININSTADYLIFRFIPVCLIASSIFVLSYYSRRIIACSLNKSRIILLLAVSIIAFAFGIYAIITNSSVIFLLIFLLFLLLNADVCLRFILRLRDIAVRSIRFFFLIFSSLVLLFIISWVPYAVIKLIFLKDDVLSVPWIYLLILYSVSFLVLDIIQCNYFLKYSPPTSYTLSRNFVKKYKITKREKDIILLLQEGYTSKSIGERLYLSQQTVKNYLYKIYRKVDVGNKVELLNVIQAS